MEEEECSIYWVGVHNTAMVVVVVAVAVAACLASEERESLLRSLLSLAVSALVFPFGRVILDASSLPLSQQSLFLSSAFLPERAERTPFILFFAQSIFLRGLHNK